tara:strand:+ start:32 stop:739 length:708 start_codon:yes stop_codon:yes gene_type:complete
MIKLIGLLEDTLLYEGLIYTHDIDTTVDHLNRWSNHNSKFIIKKTARNTIQLNFGKQLNNNELHNLLKWINNLGWFVSEYRVNDGGNKIKKFIDEPTLIDDVNKHALLHMSLEAKYDLELNKYELEDLYHITPSKNDTKIEKIGLVPRSLNKISYHPERIYLTTDKNNGWALAHQFKDKTEDFTLYKINTDGLRRHNNGIRFFKDPNLIGGLYTLSNIPSKYLIKISNQTIYKND